MANSDSRSDSGGRAALPTEANIVIVGGGVVGCSIAFHLAREGCSDVVLLERKSLTCGTTWHAAGLCGQMRASREMARLALYGNELLAELESITGHASGFKQNGAVNIALTADRLEEYRRMASVCQAVGLPVHELGLDDIKSKWPHLHIADIAGGVWIPTDGQTNPIDTTRAFAKGARDAGALILEETPVVDLWVEDDQMQGVVVQAQGGRPHRLRAREVVLACGMWTRELAGRIGAVAPLAACEHFYAVTEPLSELRPDLPVLRVQDEYAYYKEDAGKLLVGAFEPVAKPWGQEGIAADHAFETLPEDVAHFAPVLDLAVKRVPLLEQAGIALFFSGPESFTPDGRFLLGPSPQIDHLYLACGLNSIGIQSAAGLGRTAAAWFRGQKLPFDVSGCEAERMHPLQANTAYVFDRATETVGAAYHIHYPHYQYKTARGVRRTPLHDRWLGMGAVFGEVSGWERPNWFANPGQPPVYRYAFGPQNWEENCRTECLATRDAVGLLDLGSFGRIAVEGRDAVALLSRVAACEPDVAVGRVVYTVWLNDRGGIEADLTMTRLSETQFIVTTGAATLTRTLGWLRRHARAFDHLFLRDVTAESCFLGLMGPKSRELLQTLTSADLSPKQFRFARSQDIELGYGIVRAQRLSFVGELGWELFIPTELAFHTLELLLEAGQAYGLRPVGLHALDAMRQEKGFVHFGHDVGPFETPYQAGLGFSVRARGGYIGEEALRSERALAPDALTKRRVFMRLADPAERVYHEEPIYCGDQRGPQRGDQAVGYVTSGSAGFRLNASCAQGYLFHPEGVTETWVQTGSFYVRVANREVALEMSLRPFYDPDSIRMRA